MTRCWTYQYQQWAWLGTINKFVTNSCIYSYCLFQLQNESLSLKLQEEIASREEIMQKYVIYINTCIISWVCKFGVGVLRSWNIVSIYQFFIYLNLIFFIVNYNI